MKTSKHGEQLICKIWQTFVGFQLDKLLNKLLKGYGAVYILRSQKIQIFDPLPPPVHILFTLGIPPWEITFADLTPPPNLQKDGYLTEKQIEDLSTDMVLTLFCVL